MKEVITIYFKDEDNKIIQKTIDVNLVPNYFDMGWTIEKPKSNEEKPILKKSIKKESSK